MSDEWADAVADTMVRVVQPLTARLAAAELQIAALSTLQGRLDVLDARTLDLATKDVGALRERVAVVETRPPIQGPPGQNGRDGMTDFELVYVGQRRLAIKFVNADGPQERTATIVGLPLVRGVWAAGEYEAGDQVTWQGGTWHCSAATTTTGKPGESADWTLIVKRGKDGKDGRP